MKQGWGTAWKRSEVLTMYRMAKRGCYCEEIAATLGRSEAAVRGAARYHRVTLRSRRHRYTGEDLETIQRMYSRGASRARIANFLGVSRESIEVYLRRHRELCGGGDEKSEGM